MPSERERDFALERALLHHRHSRRHVEMELAARRNVEFYSDGESGLDAEDVGLRVKSCLDRIERYQKLESCALRLLNDALLDAGHGPGDVAEVDRHLYGVADSGLLAVHLGRQIPTDEELANAFEPMPGSRDDAAEDRDSYMDAVRTFFG